MVAKVRGHPFSSHETFQLAQEEGAARQTIGGLGYTRGKRLRALARHQACELGRQARRGRSQKCYDTLMSMLFSAARGRVEGLHRATLSGYTFKPYVQSVREG